MKVLNELFYAKSHEWLKVEGQYVYVGITDYAQTHLGEVVFVDLPEVDSEFEAGEQLAEVESVKAVSEIFTPVSGKILKINEGLLDNPGLVNEDAFGSWFVQIEMSDEVNKEGLLSAAEYTSYCEALDEEAGQ